MLVVDYLSEFFVQVRVSVDHAEDLAPSKSMARLGHLIFAWCGLPRQLSSRRLLQGSNDVRSREETSLELPSFLSEEQSTFWNELKASSDRQALATS